MPSSGASAAKQWSISRTIISYIEDEAAKLQEPPSLVIDYLVRETSPRSTRNKVKIFIEKLRKKVRKWGWVGLGWAGQLLAGQVRGGVD